MRWETSHISRVLMRAAMSGSCQASQHCMRRPPCVCCLSASATILRRSAGVAEILEEWLHGSTDFETVWDLSFGRVLRALESNEVDAVDALVEVALLLAGPGPAERWSAALSVERRLLWRCRWLLPAVVELAVRFGPDVVVLDGRTSAGKPQRVTFRRDAQGCLASGAKPLIQVGARQPLALVPADAVPPA